MKRILTGIKRVLDYNVRIRVKADGSGLDTAGLKMSTNPFDEIALEEAIRIRESGAVDEVVAVSIGSNESQTQLRAALAMGADRAILVEVSTVLEPLDIAHVFLKLIERELPTLVILGKQAVDDDNGQTGQMLAALWNRPQATFASAVQRHDTRVTVTREVDAGLEILELSLPALVTADLRLNQPRYVKLPEIMKAKKKPLEVIALSTLCVETRQRLRVLSYAAPPQRQKGVIVRSAQELVDTLKQKGVLA
jgi:electron transfer flavoprotein beta subunit